MSWIVSTLQYLGITPDKIVPLLLVGGITFFIVWKYFLGDLKKDIGKIKDEATDLHNAAKEIQKHLEDGGFSPQHQLGQKTVFCYGESHSPIRPNEKGKKLLKDSGFDKKVLPVLEQEIYSLMDSKGLRTLYDYEKGAEAALQELQDNPAMDSIKEYAVNHPDEPLELIFKVASWIIRDKYSEYKENRK